MRRKLFPIHIETSAELPFADQRIAYPLDQRSAVEKRPVEVAALFSASPTAACLWHPRATLYRRECSTARSVAREKLSLNTNLLRSEDAYRRQQLLLCRLEAFSLVPHHLSNNRLLRFDLPS